MDMPEFFELHVGGICPIWAHLHFQRGGAECMS